MFCWGVQICEEGSKSASGYGPGGSKSARFGRGSKSAVTPERASEKRLITEQGAWNQNEMAGRFRRLPHLFIARRKYGGKYGNK